jgi:hypothetical protein
MDELKDKSNIETDICSWVVKVSDCLPLQHNGYFLLLVLITAYIQCVIVYFFIPERKSYKVLNSSVEHNTTFSTSKCFIF